jgi:uncharacterized damage-inducible protein DinB
MPTLYKADDSGLLISLLGGEGVFLEPAAVLDGLMSEQADAKPHNLPHSIAEIVAHLCYWQEWMNRCATTGFSGLPPHAADGWPAVPAGRWDSLRMRYLHSIEEAKRIAAESDSLGHHLLPPGVQDPFFAKASLGSGIVHTALHNAHHLGQIITLRQLIGSWPPPGGSMTW